MENPLILLTDGYGGRGGIAQYNRHLIAALSEIKKIKKINVLQRKVIYKLEKIPKKVKLIKNISNSKFRFFIKIINFLFFKKNYDVVFCCHIHLLPFAWILSKKNECPLVLTIYGEEAWNPTRHIISNFLCNKIDYLCTIRHYTAKKFISWSKISVSKYFYIPNCVDPKKFNYKFKNIKLIKKYNLQKKKIILSCGRMDVEDKNKGIDEIIEILGELSRNNKDIIYLIVGDGDDKNRLEQKVKSLKVNHLVSFLGNLDEREKIDLFKIGHIMAMPGSRKTFDRYPYRFVNLEALCSGMYVICSRVNYKSEINDPSIRMLNQVNPNNKRDLINEITKLFNKKKITNQLIKKFYFNHFKNKLENMINIIDAHRKAKEN